MLRIAVDRGWHETAWTQDGQRSRWTCGRPKPMAHKNCKHYPGVVEQSGIVLVEIFEVLDDSVWEILDRFEGFDSSCRGHTLFYRKQVRLLRPEIPVSVYFLGRETPRGRKCNAKLDFAPLIDQTQVANGIRTNCRTIKCNADSGSLKQRFKPLKDFCIPP
jgi:gamma-glutamylcyclotransferase (GGCT)/AIG2-like uncharacterized protein YtfP